MKRTMKYSVAFPPKKDEEGRYLCRWCGKVLSGRATSFCSKECRDEALIRCWPSHARNLVFQRDKGICAACGLDTVKALDIIRDTMRHVYGEEYLSWNGHVARRSGLTAIEQFLGINRGNTTTLWEANHIVAVAEGGGACGLDNFETLCRWCHLKHTRELRQRLKAARAAARQLESPQLHLVLSSEPIEPAPVSRIVRRYPGRDPHGRW